jgi:hypothetical protein
MYFTTVGSAIMRSARGILHTVQYYNTNTVEPRFTNLIRSWRPFVTRNVRKPKLSVLSESYTATDALPPTPPPCRQPLLPACVLVSRDTVRHPRRFLFGKFVREPICSWWEAFVNRGSPVYAFFWQDYFTYQHSDVARSVRKGAGDSTVAVLASLAVRRQRATWMLNRNS